MIRKSGSHNDLRKRREKSATGESSHFQGAEVVPGEMIVKLKSGAATESALAPFADAFQARVVERFEVPKDLLQSFGGDLVRLKLPPGTPLKEALKTLGQEAEVAYAEPNFVYRLATQESRMPNDLHPDLWNLHNVGQTGGTPGADVQTGKAWELETGDGSFEGPLIAVVDSGVDYHHLDLKANLWSNPGEVPGDGLDNDRNGVVDDIHGYNAFEDNGDPFDGNSHGTHCAGTIAAVGNNGAGITGVMQNANLMAIKIFSDDGRTSVDAVVRGLLYAAKMGVDITSNSWGGNRHSQAVYEAFKANDALHIVAAGNSGTDNDQGSYFPANYDLENMVVVAATDADDEKAWFSQYGANKVDVAAPGSEIYSTVPGDQYLVQSGTSMAAPHVAGGAGLLLSRFPDADNAELKARLIYGSDRKPQLTDVSVSDGRVNFAASLEDDTVSPGRPNDFQVRELSSRGGVLSWTAVGDDHWCGEPAQTIELRMSSAPITEENYHNAPSVSLSGPDSVGELMSFSFGGLPKESPTAVHFAMRSIDNVGNRSALATASAVIPGAHVVLQESFDGGTQFVASGSFTPVAEKNRGKVYSTAVSDGGRRLDSLLTSPVVDLREKQNSYLTFDSELALFYGERALVEISEEGEAWQEVANLGLRNKWEQQALDLTEFDGKRIRLRFSHRGQDGRISGKMKLDRLKLVAD